MPGENWILDLQLREQIGQRALRFVMHVGDAARLGERIGVAGAIARVNRHGASRGDGYTRGKIFPVRDGTQAFVEEYKFRRNPVEAGNTSNFKTAALHGDVESVLLYG